MKPPAAALIVALGVDVTLRRRPRDQVDATTGREAIPDATETEIRAIVGSSTWFENASPGGESRSRTVAHLDPGDFAGVDLADEDVELEVESRSWRVIHAEPARLGAVRLHLEHDD